MLNKCAFIGNLGKDPEIRSLSDGKKMASLSLGVSERWKDKSTGEQKSKTEWVKVAIFNDGLAGVAEKYLHKGSKIYIEGAMQTRKYTDKDGVEKYSTEIVLQGFDSKLIMLDGKSGGSDTAESEPKPMGADAKQVELDDSIPFVWALPLAFGLLASVGQNLFV